MFAHLNVRTFAHRETHERTLQDLRGSSLLDFCEERGYTGDKMESLFIRRDRWIYSGIFFLAFFIRFLYLLQIRDHPYFSTLLGDPSYFDLWAQKIAQGQFVGAEPDGGEEAFFRGPLYALFLASIYWIFGHNLFIPRLIQIFLGSINCVLIALIARRIFDQKVAILAGILSALCGSLIYFDGEILMETLFIFLNLLTLFLLVREEAKVENLQSAIGNRKFFFVGFLIGLSAITRPNILIFFVVLLVYLTIHFKRFGVETRWRLGAMSLLLVLILGTSLPILPVTLYNLIMGKDFVIISYQAGVNFYIGNNPYSDGKSAVIPGVGADWNEISLAERDVGRHLKPSEVDRYWWEKGFQFLLEDPKSFGIIFLKKFLYFWNGFEIGNNKQPYYYAEQFSLLNILLFRLRLLPHLFLHIPFGFLAPLGLLGIWIAWREEKPISFPLLFLLSYMFSVLLFFVCDRYRLPVVPIVILFSAFGLVKIWEFRILPSTSPMPLSATFRIFILLLLFLSINIDLAGSQVYNLAREHFNLGLIYMMREEPEVARAEFQKALEIQPNFRRAHLNLGVLYFRRGEGEKAFEEYQKEIKMNPNEARTYNNLAVLSRMEGRLEESKRLCLKAIALNPRFQEPYLNLARTYEEMDSLLAVERTYIALLEFNPRSFEAYQGLGRIYDRMNQIERSILSYKKALQLESDPSGMAETLYNLGVVYGKADSIEQALESLKRAVELNPKLAQAHHNIGMVYFHKGKLEEAITAFQRAIESDSSLVEPHITLALIFKELGRREEAFMESRKVEAIMKERGK